MRLRERVQAIEARRQAIAPPLPALVLKPSDDEAARRREFIAQHGRPPALVIAVHRVSARKDSNDAC